MGVKKNYIYSMLYEILVMCLPLITAPYIARVFGSEGVGKYSYTYSIAIYFVMFARLGIVDYGNRTIAKVREDREKLNKTFTSIYLIQIILTSIVSVIYIVYALNLNEEYRIVAIIQSIFVISAIFDINWLFFGLEKFKITVTRNSIIKIITVVLVMLLVKEENQLWLYTLIMVGGMLISQIVLWGFVKRYVSFVRVTLKDIKKHIRPIIVLFIPVASLSIFKTMDKIMLGNMVGMKEVGFYQNSQQILGFPQGIITALGAVMLPRIANISMKNNKKQYENYMEKSLLLVGFLSCAFSFGIAAIAPEFVPFFLGENFREASMYVILLAPTIILISWSYTIRAQYLIPLAKDKVYVRSTIFAAIINFILNIILIEKIGLLGVIVATLVAESFLAIYQSLYASKELRLLKYLKRNIIFILIGMIMFIAVRQISEKIPEGAMGILLEICYGGIIYIILSGIYLYKIEKEVLKKFILKMKKERVKC